MRAWRWHSKVLFALLVAAFAYSVWPTPWRYFTVERPGQFGGGRLLDDVRVGAPGGTALVRVNRFTGSAYVYESESTGWRPYNP